MMLLFQVSISICYHLFIVVCFSPRSIGIAVLQNQFRCFMFCNKPPEEWAHKLSVSRQIIKPQGQRAGLILDTVSICQWPFIRTQMKTERTFAVNCHFPGHEVHREEAKLTLSPLFASLLPHLSVLCLKHHTSHFCSGAHPPLDVHRGFRFAQAAAAAAVTVVVRLWCGLTMWLVPLRNLIILTS